MDGVPDLCCIHAQTTYPPKILAETPPEQPLENATNGISSASADAVRRTNVALARATLGIQELLCAAVKAEGGTNPGIVKVS